MFEEHMMDKDPILVWYWLEKMRKTKVFHTCRICKKRIPTRWVGNILEGDFVADDVVWSEVLDCCVAWPNQIVCNDCFATRRRNK